jgi:hypothetical protein
VADFVARIWNLELVSAGRITEPLYAYTHSIQSNNGMRNRHLAATLDLITDSIQEQIPR